MTLPGPSGILWAGELLLFGALALGLGELVLLHLRPRVPLVRGLDLVERPLVGLYVGGAVLYVLAALPIGAFSPIGVGATVALLLGLAIGRLRGIRVGDQARRIGSTLARHARRPEYLLLGTAFVAALAVELVSAVRAPTGNTYDSSLLALYTSLLLQHHSLPLTLAPVTSISVAYPQGTTVWFAAAQSLFGLPPARTSLLVTPLFLALAPVGAFSFGNRLAGGARSGAAFALVFALMAPFTRGLVGGSNDFVLAFPLVLFLAGRSTLWTLDRPPSWPDALAFGALSGYAAALNPVGVQWLFVTLPALALLARPRFAGAPGRWIARWVASVAVALALLAPTLAVLWAGRGSPSLTEGAGPPLPGTPIGVAPSQFLGGIDPFLFRPGDTWLSPFPVLRAELAALLVIGAVLLLWGRATRERRSMAPFSRFALAGGVVTVALIGAAALARQGIPGFTTLVFLTNATEASILLFSLFAAVAAVPIAALLDRGRAPAGAPIGETPVRWRRTGATLLSGSGAVVLAALLLVPGAVLTTTALPGHLDDLYGDFSTMSSADFDLLGWASGHLAPGDRVVVAPGSVAEFLPSYAPGITLLYPMVPNFASVNASYALLVRSLTNGTLGNDGLEALAALAATEVVITENNTVLFPAFSPAPLLGSSSFCELFHSDDAYVFAVEPSASPGAACATGP